MKEQSPIIFWLLLAATLCLDALAAVWILRGQGRVIQTFFMALTYAQLSTLCVWAVLFHVRLGALWCLPFGAGLLAALIIVGCAFLSEPSIPLLASEGILVFTGVFWLHVGTILIVLWALKPTRLFAGYMRAPRCVPWQFATRHLLVVMTGVPIVIVVLTSSVEFQRAAVWITLWTAGSVLLTVFLGSVVPATWPLPLRLAASLGASLVIGVISNWLASNGLVQTPRPVPIDFLSFYLIQAILVWSWLEVLYTRNGREEAIAAADESG